MKITDLLIDVKSLGEQLWLVGVVPTYAYQDNKRTDTISGYKYVVTLPQKGFEKVAIKIDGQKQLEPPENGHIEVKFENLELFIFWMNGTHNVGAKATKISLVGNAKA